MRAAAAAPAFLPRGTSSPPAFWGTRAGNAAATLTVSPRPAPRAKIPRIPWGRSVLNRAAGGRLRLDRTTSRRTPPVSPSPDRTAHPTRPHLTGSPPETTDGTPLGTTAGTRARAAREPLLRLRQQSPSQNPPGVSSSSLIGQRGITRVCACACACVSKPISPGSAGDSPPQGPRLMRAEAARAKLGLCRC